MTAARRAVPRQVPREVFVQAARRTKGYALRLTFSDGTHQTIDFRKFLDASKNPQIRAFLDPKKFASFSVDNGDLLWGDWELVFPIADLYQGRV